MNFIIIFGKFVTKHRAFGNSTIFLQQFFQLRGGIFPSLNPPVASVSSTRHGDGLGSIHRESQTYELTLRFARPRKQQNNMVSSHSFVGSYNMKSIILRYLLGQSWNVNSCKFQRIFFSVSCITSMLNVKHSL